MTDISYFNVIFRWLQIVSNWLLNVTGYKKDKMIVNCPFNGMVKIKFYKKFFLWEIFERGVLRIQRPPLRMADKNPRVQ